MAALIAGEDGRGLHLIERTNIDFVIRSTIAPQVSSLTRFKVTGKLPSLAANLSNLKYQGIMRLIDIVVPNFDDGSSPVPTAQPSNHSDPPKPPSDFSRKAEEYGNEGEGRPTVEDKDNSNQRDGKSDSFVDAESGPRDVSRRVNPAKLQPTFSPTEQKSSQPPTLVRVFL